MGKLAVLCRPVSIQSDDHNGIDFGIQRPRRNLPEPQGVDDRLTGQEAIGTHQHGCRFEVAPLGIANRKDLETLVLEDVGPAPGRALGAVAIENLQTERLVNGRRQSLIALLQTGR